MAARLTCTAMHRTASTARAAAGSTSWVSLMPPMPCKDQGPAHQFAALQELNLRMQGHGRSGEAQV